MGCSRRSRPTRGRCRSIRRIPTSRGDPLHSCPCSRRILVANRGEIAARASLRALPRAFDRDRSPCTRRPTRDAPWLAGGHADRLPRTREGVPVVPRPGTRSSRRPSRPRRARSTPGTGSSRRTPCSPRAAPSTGSRSYGPPALPRSADGGQARGRSGRWAAAGVPTIPGSLDALSSARRRGVRSPSGTGYPVLLKAAGRGRRQGDASGATTPRAPGGLPPRRRSRRSMPSAIQPLPREVPEGGRHIEFQILADAYGHAFTWASASARCSVTIRSSSRSPLAGDHRRRARRARGPRGRAAAASFGYVSAGTLEVPARRGGQPRTSWR
jgi:hypothetical protein